MAFPPRHPMGIPGMPPLPPGMVPPPPAYPFAPMMAIPGLMPGQILPPGMMPGLGDARAMTANHRGAGPHIVRRSLMSRRIYENQMKPSDGQGPTITVFVGNITERAIDGLVKQVLQKCGAVVSWKRVQGASGKLQAFGFCEYGDPESALRAIRLLHDWEIGEKKLVVKVDAKTKALLDEYKANKRKERQEMLGDGAGGKTPTESERDDDEELDEDTKKYDSIVRTGIQVLLREYEYDLSRPVSPPEQRKRGVRNSSRNADDNDNKDSNDNLDEMDLEEDKKSLIHREIGKFRDNMKKQEELKEKERERRERDKERRDRGRPGYHHSITSSMTGSQSTTINSSNRLHGRPSPPERSHDRSRSRSRERERERLERERERDREREREREERSRDREAANLERAREKEYDRDKREKEKEREREEEEEAYDRRKLERKLREKEAAYQERLKIWETRERKKCRDYEKHKEKDDERHLDESKEAKRLKEFLEDYDDERDDVKFYKGSMLTRRLKEREKEVDADNRDRQREKEELEELRQKLLEEGHPDPSAELERITKEAEEKFKPLINVEVDRPDITKLLSKSTSTLPRVLRNDEDSPQKTSSKTSDYQQATNNNSSGRLLSGGSASGSASSLITTTKHRDHESRHKPQHGFYGPNSPSYINSIGGDGDNGEEMQAPNIPIHAQNSQKEELRPKLLGFSTLKMANSPTQQLEQPSVFGKKKKLTVGEVFNMDEDEHTDGNIRKRKLVPLDYSEDEKKAVGGNQVGATSVNPNQEEKRKHIKNLIDKIPTEKDKLFEYIVDWTIVDGVLMERRIRPWINKKIVEYIGEEEPTLVDFICSKLMAGSTPQSILDDVQMVLDDEAEVFVVKMWRLLIYEIEAKKLGLVK